MPYSTPTDISTDPTRSMSACYLSAQMYSYNDYISYYEPPTPVKTGQIHTSTSAHYFPNVYEDDIYSHTRFPHTNNAHTTIASSWQAHEPHDKPPYSYATLIAHAILSSEQKRLPLSDIYQWIAKTYPYYSPDDHGWQNSIRHNLSLNKSFIKRERSSKKGCFWAIQPGKEQAFIDKIAKRGNAIGKSPTLNEQFGANKRLSKNGELEARASNAPLLTTFRTTPISTGKQTTKRTKRKSACIQQEISWHVPLEAGEEDVKKDSDSDSGVDVGIERSKKLKRQDQKEQHNGKNDNDFPKIDTALSKSFQGETQAHSTCSSYPSAVSACHNNESTRFTPAPLTSTALYFGTLSLGDSSGISWPESATVAPSEWLQTENLERSFSGHRMSNDQCAYGLGASTVDLLRSLDW